MISAQSRGLRWTVGVRRCVGVIFHVAYLILFGFVHSSLPLQTFKLGLLFLLVAEVPRCLRFSCETTLRLGAKPTATEIGSDR